VRPSNPLENLLEVVDRLTLKHKTSVHVESDDGAESKVWIEHEPLLKQLRNMIVSSTGGNVAGSGLPSERNVLDFDALELYDTMTEHCATLFKGVSSAQPFDLPENNLRHWFIEFKRLFEQKKCSVSTLQKHIRKLNSMAASIDNKISPPTILEITAPCPRCEATHGVDSEGVYRRAIIVESRITQYRSLDNTRALCVACRATWLHGRGMRQLRYEIDVRDIVRHADKEKMLTIEQVFGNYDTIEVRSTSVPNSEDGA